MNVKYVSTEPIPSVTRQNLENKEDYIEDEERDHIYDIMDNDEEY